MTRPIQNILRDFITLSILFHTKDFFLWFDVSKKPDQNLLWRRIALSIWQLIIYKTRVRIHSTWRWNSHIYKRYNCIYKFCCVYYGLCWERFSTRVNCYSIWTYKFTMIHHVFVLASILMDYGKHIKRFDKSNYYKIRYKMSAFFFTKAYFTFVRTKLCYTFQLHINWYLMLIIIFITKK